MLTNPLPNYLRSYRRKAGLTQEAVAFLLGGTHGSTINRHEEGNRLPSLKTALRYAAVFSSDPRTMFGGHAQDAHRLVQKRAALLLEKLGSRVQEHEQHFLEHLAYEPDSYLVPCERDGY